jgi:hypothetical protein
MVDQSARWGLGKYSGDAANRKGDPDAFLVPLVAGQIDREEGSNSRQDVREEEIQPIQATQRSS